MSEILTLRPLSAGSSGQTSVGAGASRVEAVQEVASDGDTSYVYAAGGAGAKLDYFLPDGNGFPPNVTITNVTVFVMAKFDGLGTGATVSISIKTGETQGGGGSNTLTGSYTQYSTSWPLNPGTFQPWTKYEIDVLEIGYLLYGGMGVAQARVTQCWVEVEYEPTTDALFFGA